MHFGFLREENERKSVFGGASGRQQKYVLYIETLTSRHGMENKGVSVVAATTYEHFDESGYGWNGEKDDSSAVAGKTFVSQ